MLYVKSPEGNYSVWLCVADWLLPTTLFRPVTPDERVVKYYPGKVTVLMLIGYVKVASSTYLVLPVLQLLSHFESFRSCIMLSLLVLINMIPDLLVSKIVKNIHKF